MDEALDGELLDSRLKGAENGVDLEALNDLLATAEPGANGLFGESSEDLPEEIPERSRKPSGPRSTQIKPMPRPMPLEIPNAQGTNRNRRSLNNGLAR